MSIVYDSIVRRFGVVVLFLTAGCSLITDLDALQSKGDASSDAGVTTDAPIQDSPVADSIVDAVTMEADTGGQGFCATQGMPKLCEDFDTGLFSAKFSQVHKNGGNIDSSNAAFKSSPSSLLAQIPMSDAGSASTYVTKFFLGTGATFTFAFDFRADAWVTGGASCVIAGIRIDDGLPTEHTLNLYVTDSYAAVEEIYKMNNVNQFVDHPLTTHPQLNQWVHFVVTLDAQARTAKVEMDNTTVLASTNLHSSWASGTPLCNLGISYVASTTAPWAMRYDNVVLDFK